MCAKAVALAARPEGMPKTSDFQIVDIESNDPADGEIQVKNICMSVDPYMRGRMVDRKSYVPPFQIGEPLTGGAIGKVIKSAHPDFKEGDFVSSHWGWRDGFTARAEGIEKKTAATTLVAAAGSTVATPGPRRGCCPSRCRAVGAPAAAARVSTKAVTTQTTREAVVKGSTTWRRCYLATRSRAR